MASAKSVTRSFSASLSLFKKLVNVCKERGYSQSLCILRALLSLT